MVQEWECDGCEKKCKRYTDDTPLFQDKPCPDSNDPKLIAHFNPIDRQEITEEEYLEALNIYLEIAYPDGKPIWHNMMGKRVPDHNDSCYQKRQSTYFNASEEPHRSVFFGHGIPPSITFGSWIQPQMKLRYDDVSGCGVKNIWVESNERSVDGELACELSKEIKHEIEKAWKDRMPEYYNDIASHLPFPDCSEYCQAIIEFGAGECEAICPDREWEEKVTWYCEYCSGIVKLTDYDRWICKGCGRTHGDEKEPSHAKQSIKELGESCMKEPMTWYCENCDEYCPKKPIQNNKPSDADCPEGLKPTWYARRWLSYSEPNPDYDKWLHLYGTDADKILWDQEKKDRGVE